MTRRRPPFIPQRRPVYIGCEGASEISYAGFLQDLLREAALPVHLVVEELGPGAGDPLARVDMAVRRLAHLRRTRTAPQKRFVLLDHDQAQRDPHKAKGAAAGRGKSAGNRPKSALRLALARPFSLCRMMAD